jgi:hypothetical protein
MRYVIIFIYLSVYIYGHIALLLYSNNVLFSLWSPLEHIISQIQYYIMYISFMIIIFYAIYLLFKMFMFWTFLNKELLYHKKLEKNIY